MLPRVNRLKSIKLHSPIILREKNLLLKFCIKSAGESRFSFVIGKKIFKSAVKRNALKRNLVVCVRSLLGRISNPIDASIIVRSRFLQEEKNICVDVENLFKKSGLLI